MKVSSKTRRKANLLKHICIGSAVTRTSLVHKTGLSKMSVSNFINELGSDGYIIETENNNSGGALQGRPPLVIDISPAAPLVPAIYISRNICQLALFNLKAKMVKYVYFEMSEVKSEEMLLLKLESKYRELVDGLTLPLLGIGISSIGPIDRSKGIILNPPDFNGLSNISIQPFFAKLTGLPVYFDNNMSGAALAEAIFGQGKDLLNFAYLGVSRGVAAGVILNGNLINGTTGISGEIGHTSIKFDGPYCFCGNRGCLELYTSIPVIINKAQVMMSEAGIISPEEVLTWESFVNYANNNEYYTLKALDEFCEYLSIAIVNLVNMFDCDEVFLGHEIAMVSGLIESKLVEYANSRIFSRAMRAISVRKSTFGENAALTGAACFVLNELFRGTLPQSCSV